MAKNITNSKSMLAINIKKIRDKWGFSQSHFAKMFSDMNRGKIASYEIETEPGVGFMIELSNLSNIQIHDIYSRELMLDEIPLHPLTNNKIKAKSEQNKNLLVGDLQSYLEKLEERISDLEDQNE